MDCYNWRSARYSPGFWLYMHIYLLQVCPSTYQILIKIYFVVWTSYFGIYSSSLIKDIWVHILQRILLKSESNRDFLIMKQTYLFFLTYSFVIIAALRGKHFNWFFTKSDVQSELNPYMNLLMNSHLICLYLDSSFLSWL